MTLPLTIKDAAIAFRECTLTSVALTEGLLARADELDSQLGIYITRMDETALAAAARADANFENGVDLGPLQGIPVGLKDILSTDDAPTTAQSMAMDPNWGKQGDGPAVRRLREAGAVIIGKNTTNEFASGQSDPAKPFPVAKNPWNVLHTPGGSSSGTGAGVAAGFFLGGVGTDTGGSVRWPAAANGVSGMKGTYGLVPRSGCTYNGFSLDHIGPLARTAWDCAALLEIMAGFDATDPASANVVKPDYTGGLDGNLAGLRVGVLRMGNSDAPDTSPEVRAAFEDALGVFTNAGAYVSDVEIRYFDEIIAANWVNNCAEKSGIYVDRYRKQWDDWGRYARVGLGAFGLFLSPSDFVQSLKVRTWAKKQFDRLMLDYDVILTPSTKGPAGLAADMGYLKGFGHGILLTALWSFIGYPAISVPMGLASNGLPLSLQIAGKPFDDAGVLHAADAYQQLTNFHLQLPPILRRPARSRSKRHPDDLWPYRPHRTKERFP